MDDRAAPGWEVLSTYFAKDPNPNPNANPNPDSAKTGDNLAPQSLFRYPVLHDPRIPDPSPQYGSALGTSNWSDDLHDGTSTAGADKIVEGHMPPQSAPARLHVHDGTDVYSEENVSSPDQDMAASQDLTIEAAETLLGVSSSKAGAEEAPKKKARHFRSGKVVWTIAVAATIVGIVMLGRRMQAELYQKQQLQLELSIKDEKLDELTRQVSSLKDVLRRHYTARSSTF